MTMKLPSLKALSQGLREAGPYLLIELLLPGGTLIAVLLWLSQQNWADTPQPAPLTATIAAQVR